MVHTHGKITGWGKLLKKKPPPFRVTKRVSVPFRKRGFEVKYPERVTVKSNCVRRAYGKGTQKMKSCTVLRLFFIDIYALYFYDNFKEVAYGL